MPFTAPLGASETEQATLSFAGSIHPPICPIHPGLKPVDKTAIPFPANSFPHGGFTAMDILCAFGALKQPAQNNNFSADDEAKAKPKRKPWTRELKNNGIRYALTTIMPATKTKF